MNYRFEMTAVADADADGKKGGWTKWAHIGCWMLVYCDS